MLSSLRLPLNLTVGHRITSLVNAHAYLGSDRIRNVGLIHKSSLRRTHGQPQQSHQATGQIKLADKIHHLNKELQPKLLSIPNLITSSRLALAPVVGYLLCNDMQSHAMACVAVAAFTDFADKFSAKMLNQTSPFNMVLDYVADKVFLVTCLVTLYNLDMIQLWIIKGILTRELVFALGGGFLRWGGLGESVTLKKFFDFNNYPTLGLEPPIVSKAYTALTYLLVISNLASAPVATDRIYNGWPYLGLEVTTGLVCAATMAHYFRKLGTHLIFSRPVKT